MRICIFLLIFCIFALICNAQETEAPEPTGAPEVSYEVRIRWGSLLSGDEFEAPSSFDATLIEGAPPASHSYSLHILDPEDPHVWISEAPDSEPGAERSLLVTVYVDHIGGPWSRFGFYRLQVRQIANGTQGEWSDMSWWVPVLDLRLGRFVKS